MAEIQGIKIYIKVKHVIIFASIDIVIILGGQEDYSTYTTIAVISMDVSSTGVVSIEVLDENVSAIVSAETIALGDGEISIIS